MKKTVSLVASLTAACALMSSAAFAQDMPPPGTRHGDAGMRGPGPDHRDPGMRPGPNRPPMHRPGGPVGMDAHGPEGGPGPMDGDWHRRGRPLPREYRDRQYVINDYRQYQLQPPPRGYQWVGVGGDYLLVAITSGVIRDIVTGR